ncbi:MAG: hypothetical protein L6Q97_00005 [Thermoanaerobaculia bacterium]|nr:hypothetical protein [Thermoanaerobaculia bacterium]
MVEILSNILTGIIADLLRNLITGKTNHFTRSEIEQIVKKTIQNDFSTQDNRLVSEALKEITNRLERLEAITIRGNIIELNKNFQLSESQIIQEIKSHEGNRKNNLILDPDIFHYLTKK